MRFVFLKLLCLGHSESCSRLKVNTKLLVQCAGIRQCLQCPEDANDSPSTLPHSFVCIQLVIDTVAPLWQTA